MIPPLHFDRHYNYIILVAGTPDWQSICVAIPARQDIEWKWGVLDEKGNIFMERWTNRFTLLTNLKTSNYMILAPWEVYALVLELHLPQSKHCCRIKMETIEQRYANYKFVCICSHLSYLSLSHAVLVLFRIILVIGGASLNVPFFCFKQCLR